MDSINPYLNRFCEILLNRFHVDIHNNLFLIKTGVVAAIVVLLGRLVCVLFGKTDRGFLMCFLGLTLPLILSAITLTACDLHLNNSITDPGMLNTIEYIITGLVAILSLFVISPLILGIGAGKTVFIFVFMGLASYFGVVGTNYVLNTYELTIPSLPKIHSNPPTELNSFLQETNGQDN